LSTRFQLCFAKGGKVLFSKGYSMTIHEVSVCNTQRT